MTTLPRIVALVPMRHHSERIPVIINPRLDNPIDMGTGDCGLRAAARIEIAETARIPLQYLAQRQCALLSLELAGQDLYPI